MWHYSITDGKMYAPDDSLEGSGYAGGNCGENLEGINNPAKITFKKIGPLPPGKYTFGTPVEHSQLGPFAIPLIPDTANIMYGRGGFYCHGDVIGKVHSASEGCIIMLRNVREAMWASEDHELEVVDTYEPSN